MNRGLNLNIRNRLILMLVVWIVAFMGFGIFAVFKMSDLGKVGRQIYEYSSKVFRATNEARTRVIEIHGKMQDLVLTYDKEEMSLIAEEVHLLEKKVLEQLDMIKIQATDQASLKLQEEAQVLFLRWKLAREEAIDLMLQNKHREAQELAKEAENTYVPPIGSKLSLISKNADQIGIDLMEQVKRIKKSIQYTLIILMLSLSLLLSVGFLWIIHGILKPIMVFKRNMDETTATGELKEVYISGNDEISEISSYYNVLIGRLKEQFWMKDSQNLLSKEITGSHTIEDLAQNALNFVARTLEAGKGSFYIYKAEEKALYLEAAFAFTEKDKIIRSYELGEGIVGQVALEKKPMLFTDIQADEDYVDTGLFQRSPLELYIVPLIYDEELYGVMSLSSFTPCNNFKKEFLREAVKMIAINLYSVMQGQKVKDLLELSKNTAEQLQKSNEELEWQQTILQQQTAELQQTNAELEEQHQLLQQKSEELQQTNHQLKEQQQILEVQSLMLNKKNEELEMSREELLKYNHQLKLASKYKTEFLANMSHELRTPLNSIILLSKLLIKNPRAVLSSDEIEKIEVIHNSGQELLRLINGILDLSKIEAGKQHVNISKFSSRDLLKEMEKLFKEMALKKTFS